VDANCKGLRCPHTPRRRRRNRAAGDASAVMLYCG
jgi:hypothetical protein